MHLLAARGKSFKDAINIVLPTIMTKTVQVKYSGAGKAYRGVAKKTSKGRKLLNVWKVNNLYSLYNFFQ